MDRGTDVIGKCERVKFIKANLWSGEEFDSDSVMELRDVGSLV